MRQQPSHDIASAVQAAGDVAGRASIDTGTKVNPLGSINAAVVPALIDKVTSFTSSVTDLATGAVLNIVANPLNTTMTPVPTPTAHPQQAPAPEAKQVLQQGTLTAEVALKLVEGLAPKYRQDPDTMAALGMLFAQAGSASPAMVQNLWFRVSDMQRRVDERTK